MVSPNEPRADLDQRAGVPAQLKSPRSGLVQFWCTLNPKTTLMALVLSMDTYVDTSLPK